MRRTLSRLTAREIVRLAKIPGRHPDGGGLHLVVTRSLTASWVYRYMRAGKSHDLGLGPLRIVGLKDAREAAGRYRRMRYAETPQDPLTERRSRQQAAQLTTARTMTFEECARAYIAAHQAGWRNRKHAAQWPATLKRYAFPVFGALPVQTIDTALLMKVIEPIWQTRTETASRLRGRIEKVIDWATTRGYRPEGRNPAAWRGHLENLLPKKSKVRSVEHLAALAYTDLPLFMAELRDVEGFAARALEFLILTAARTGEVRGAVWPEFDLPNRLWSIPPDRTKAKREHRVPLSDRAMQIIEEMEALRSCEHVFPSANGKRAIGVAAMILQLRRMGRGDLTVHGFRSTFSDWCAEQTSTPSEVREMALAHAVSDRVEAAYRRGDLFEKRRALAAAWSTFCSQSGDKNVVPLRRAAE